MNLRLGTLLWMCMIMAAALGLYMVKYRVQHIKDEVAEVAREIEQEQEALHVLSAEWAYLTRPQRLQELSAKYLSLVPAQPVQMTSMDALPMPGEPAPGGDDEAVAPQLASSPALAPLEPFIAPAMASASPEAEDDR